VTTERSGCEARHKEILPNLRGFLSLNVVMKYWTSTREVSSFRLSWNLRGPKVAKTQDKTLAFEWNLKMLSKIRELTEKKEKRRKIPYHSLHTVHYIHKGTTSLGQVRISAKVLPSNRLYLPCAIWLCLVHLLTYYCFDHWSYYFISEVLKLGNSRDKEYLDPPFRTSLKTALVCYNRLSYIVKSTIWQLKVEPICLNCYL